MYNAALIYHDELFKLILRFCLEIDRQVVAYEKWYASKEKEEDFMFEMNGSAISLGEALCLYKKRQEAPSAGDIRRISNWESREFFLAEEIFIAEDFLWQIGRPANRPYAVKLWLERRKVIVPFY